MFQMHRSRHQMTFEHCLFVLSIREIYSAKYYFVDSVLIEPLMTKDVRITPL